MRVVLLLAVALAVAVLSLVIATDPRRIGIFQDHPGRTAAPGEAGWVRAGAAPIALTEVAAAAHQGRIWVAGGLDDAGRAVAHLLVYDPVGDAWAVVATVARAGPPLGARVGWRVRCSSSAGTRATASTARRPRSGASMTRMRACGPPPSRCPSPAVPGAAAWDGRASILYGGGVGPSGVSADVFILDGGEWRPLASLSRPREHLAASSSGVGSVAFLAGRDAGGNLGTVDVVSEAGEVARGPDLPTPRGGVAAFAAGALGDCVVGGEGPNGTFADVECVGATGTTTLPGLTAPRHGLGAAVLGDRAYVLLGGPRPGLTVSAVVEVLDLR